MRWVSQPVATGDSDHEATVQLSDGLLANWAIRVLAANGLIAARRTRRDPSNQPEVSRKVSKLRIAPTKQYEQLQIFIVQGIPMSLSTNPLFSHYVETILRANSIEVESVVLDRDGGYHYSVPISRELGKIKRKLFQESREIRVYLSPDLVHPNVDPNDLEQVAQFFENPHVHFPFEVKKGWTYWLQEDGGQRIWFDATGIPIEPKHDSTAELEWRDQQLAERFTDHFARLTPNPLKWRMRRRDNMGVRLTFGYRTTLFISKAVRIACDAQLRQLDEDLRLRRYPEDLPQLRDALTERERYWAQLVDMRSRQQPFETHDQDCPVQLIVEGYPRALFEEALNEVKQILAGVPLDCSDMEREGRLMHGIGLRWLKAELEKEENRCVAIDVNALRRTITFWGGTDQVDQLVNKAVHFANHSESYYIEKSIAMTPPNYPANFRSIIEGIGIQELREITGGAQFSTDDTDENGWETLIFRGSIAQFGRLEAFLQVILRELPPAVGVSTTFNYVQSCPVCFTPVTKSTGLTLTSCSHSYCLDCFINMVANKVQSRDLNFICLKEDCNIPIAIKHIMRVVVGPPSRIKSLDAAKLEPLLRALKDSIACGDTDTMRVCPTPDCFGLIPVPEEGFPIYKIRCDECGKKRCSGRNCVQPPHKGLTCEVAERIRGDADESLRVYGDRIGQDRLKKCPSCTMVIEKQLGCNHMECAKCKIHFCWLCGFQSKERSELYRHLGDTHQGYGGGFQIQGDQLVQINGEEEPIDPMNFVILEDVDGIEAGPWNEGVQFAWSADDNEEASEQVARFRTNSSHLCSSDSGPQKYENDMKEDDEQQENGREKEAETETGTDSCSRAQTVQTEQPTHNQVIPIDWKSWQPSNQPIKFVIEPSASGTTLRAGIAEIPEELKKIFYLDDEGKAKTPLEISPEFIDRVLSKKEQKKMGETREELSADTETQSNSTDYSSSSPSNNSPGSDSKAWKLPADKEERRRIALGEYLNSMTRGEDAKMYFRTQQYQNYWVAFWSRFSPEEIDSKRLGETSIRNNRQKLFDMFEALLEEEGYFDAEENQTGKDEADTVQDRDRGAIASLFSSNIHSPLLVQSATAPDRNNPPSHSARNPKANRQINRPVRNGNNNPSALKTNSSSSHSLESLPNRVGAFQKKAEMLRSFTQGQHNSNLPDNNQKPNLPRPASDNRGHAQQHNTNNAPSSGRFDRGRGRGGFAQDRMNQTMMVDGVHSRDRYESQTSTGSRRRRRGKRSDREVSNLNKTIATTNGAAEDTHNQTINETGSSQNSIRNGNGERNHRGANRRSRRWDEVQMNSQLLNGGMGQSAEMGQQILSHWPVPPQQQSYVSANSQAQNLLHSQQQQQQFFCHAVPSVSTAATNSMLQFSQQQSIQPAPQFPHHQQPQSVPLNQPLPSASLPVHLPANPFPVPPFCNKKRPKPVKTCNGTLVQHSCQILMENFNSWDQLLSRKVQQTQTEQTVQPQHMQQAVHSSAQQIVNAYNHLRNPALVISHQTPSPATQMQPQAFQQPYPQMSSFRQTAPVSVPAPIPTQPTAAFVANDISTFAQRGPSTAEMNGFAAGSQRALHAQPVNHQQTTPVQYKKGGSTPDEVAYFELKEKKRVEVERDMQKYFRPAGENSELLRRLGGAGPVVGFLTSTAAPSATAAAAASQSPVFLPPSPVQATPSQPAILHNAPLFDRQMAQVIDDEQDMVEHESRESFCSIYSDEDYGDMNQPTEWKYGLTIGVHRRHPLLVNGLAQHNSMSLVVMELYTLEFGRTFIMVSESDSDRCAHAEMVRFKQIRSDISICKVAPTLIRHMPFQGTVKIRPGRQISMKTIGLCGYMRSSLSECEINRIPVTIWVDQIGLLKVDARYCSRHQTRNQYDQKGYFAPLRLLEVTLQCDHHENTFSQILPEHWRMTNAKAIFEEKNSVLAGDNESTPSCYWPVSAEKHEDVLLRKDGLSDGIWEFHSSDFPTRRIWATEQQIINAQSVLNSRIRLTAVIVPIHLGPFKGTWQALIVGHHDEVERATELRIWNFRSMTRLKAHRGGCSRLRDKVQNILIRESRFNRVSGIAIVKHKLFNDFE
ncbi:hypothetical protein WR25_06968 isoform B [Diploscapter pachys]|uniref:RBR-type E3 ubiquitin transferase n=1 Tax=Diploscapter pachys TaxID=2018661 RepID=A0A2A2K3D1_9BILA|nr:hypothetical protein WR25_06968 isoform B [Diploscapter pachys]